MTLSSIESYMLQSNNSNGDYWLILKTTYNKFCLFKKNYMYENEN